MAGDAPLTMKAMQTIVADRQYREFAAPGLHAPSSFEILTLAPILKAKNIMNSQYNEQSENKPRTNSFT
ncbi:hypothetical protein C5167_036790 [Papaver somniferum]|uniref:Uncharacterized protein n=1 Tax=Papaver somniferum TaxID=3469 RepID=A0A4Y7I4Z7_PAPSO|nr:hypothetical protein C5167_036790 [Papaver somniferum]